MPRFQFRLRTLMIVVTLLAVPLGYVGWQEKIVRQRKAMLNEIKGTGGGYTTSEYTLQEVEEVRAWALIRDREHWFHERLISPGQSRNAPSPLRIVLGDERVSEIDLPETFPSDQVNEAKELFGEAIIWQSTLISDGGK